MTVICDRARQCPIAYRCEHGIRHRQTTRPMCHPRTKINPAGYIVTEQRAPRRPRKHCGKRYCLYLAMAVRCVRDARVQPGISEGARQRAIKRALAMARSPVVGGHHQEQI